MGNRWSGGNGSAGVIGEDRVDQKTAIAIIINCYYSPAGPRLNWVCHCSDGIALQAVSHLPPAHRPLLVVACHHHRPQERTIESEGCGGRGVQLVQRHARPSTITRKPQRISAGRSGSEGVMGAKTAMELTCGYSLFCSCSNSRSESPLHHISKILFSF